VVDQLTASLSLDVEQRDPGVQDASEHLVDAT
jgi:hypothetical protein